eukprot:589125-Amphidinium_carterae.2
MEISAAHGFQSMTAQSLKQKLWSVVMGSGVRAPASEDELVTGLATEVLGDDVSMESVWLHRGRVTSMHIPSAMTEEDIGTAEDVLDEMDAADIAARITEHRERDAYYLARARSEKETGNKNPKRQKRASDSQAAASSVQERQRLPAHRIGDFSAEEVRRYCAPFEVLQLSLEKTWCSRWRAKAPQYEGKNSISVCWGGKLSELQAVERVIAWS